MESGSDSGAQAPSRCCRGEIMMERLLVERLSVRFGGLQALREVSMVIQPGEIRGLIGPNGAGKTTLINAITGMVSPEAGRVLLNGQDVTSMPAHQVSRQGILRTFQHVEPFAEMSVLDNLLVAMQKGRMGLPFSLAR
ncbi:MAG: ATP-binding cassette domain-containing protein [Comamonadaceae bacterium]|nr:MAG: ATP-binding cassette domain-containing protein [Comamonadaceae bacterium]